MLGEPYFAALAYSNLKMPSPPGRQCPLVQKVATPGHNWVLVNGDAPAQDQVYVDYWMYALGVPAARCICLSTAAIVRQLLNMSPLKIIKTWDPNTSKES
jgi:hypothetical protein